MKCTKDEPGYYSEMLNEIARIDNTTSTSKAAEAVNKAFPKQREIKEHFGSFDEHKTPPGIDVMQIKTRERVLTALLNPGAILLLLAALIWIVKQIIK